MPELPEVETVCRGIRPHLQGRVFTQATVRQPQLRWPVPDKLNELLRNQTVHSVTRRAKYVLIELDQGSLMVHLGMSGRLYFVPAGTPAAKHDHVDFALDSGQLLRYTDPRRFGAVLWLDGEASEHHLLSHLGPEPLSEDFNADYLFNRAKGRKVPVKTLLMDGRVVVGVGNIYANEALFMAGIRPDREAGSISKARYQRLVMCVKQVLEKAIAQGGTTLKDFVGGDGRPGYFKQELLVYGRAGLPCPNCAGVLKEIRQAQRSTVFCSRCQR
ncbi:MAG: DNA-formamidopyrimidine glycosylase [Spongiibacter sp.]|uniref:bifunctional DNA-formamidopyrimidine glycosylase/DNA-(apurinic or apyrimidinic site) lyase n=1 Tax=Spongiibacter sp. TaxID=2024860 RepID=UPI000C0AD9A4|nr:bifunctional DNA-formamidopyrimidine glycosylase/DNA-(apurinic or apyrimidinic site) lyase [Spongiibacter sp.]MAK42588.1 DNA-formamidopyrimidine glycosylase [Spongiibacter sp.]